MPDAAGNIKGISLTGVQNAWLDRVQAIKEGRCPRCGSQRCEEERLIRLSEPDLFEEDSDEGSGEQSGGSSST